MTDPDRGSIPSGTQHDPAAWLPLYADVLRACLAAGEVLSLPVSGSSMGPAIRAGATLVVAGATPEAIRAGDVLVYEDGERVICHRALWRRRARAGAMLLTKGDRVALAPVWVRASAVIGRVVAVEAGGVRRRLDAPGERIRAWAVVGRAWTSLLARRLRRAIRGTTRPASAA
jgi:signal peptidase I